MASNVFFWKYPFSLFFSSLSLSFCSSRMRLAVILSSHRFVCGVLQYKALSIPKTFSYTCHLFPTMSKSHCDTLWGDLTTNTYSAACMNMTISHVLTLFDYLFLGMIDVFYQSAGWLDMHKTACFQVDGSVE